jgi:hypothetical protein
MDEHELQAISEFLGLVEPLIDTYGDFTLRASYALVAALVADQESGEEV